MIARLFASLLVTVCLAGTAQAQVFWGTAGNNCTSVDDGIKINLASVQHASDNIDLITLNCPVTTRFETPISNWNLSVTYRDSTGTNPSAFIRVRLFRMEIGAVTRSWWASSTPTISTQPEAPPVRRRISPICSISA